METYKIELLKNTYQEVFLPMLTKAHLKMPAYDKGDKVEIHIKRKHVFAFIYNLVLRDLGSLEEIQKAFHDKEEIN